MGSIRVRAVSSLTKWQTNANSKRIIRSVPFQPKLKSQICVRRSARILSAIGAKKPIVIISIQEWCWFCSDFVFRMNGIALGMQFIPNTDRGWTRRSGERMRWCQYCTRSFQSWLRFYWDVFSWFNANGTSYSLSSRYELIPFHDDVRLLLLRPFDLTHNSKPCSCHGSFCSHVFRNTFIVRIHYFIRV